MHLIGADHLLPLLLVDLVSGQLPLHLGELLGHLPQFLGLFRFGLRVGRTTLQLVDLLLQFLLCFLGICDLPPLLLRRIIALIGFLSHASSFFGLWPCGLTGASPYEATAANEMERQIEAALASLPATYREVLLLVGVDGFRPGEAAEICGISPEAFRQRLSRARALLAGKLDGPARSRVTALSEVTP